MQYIQADIPNVSHSPYPGCWMNFEINFYNKSKFRNFCGQKPASVLNHICSLLLGYWTI